MSEMRIQLHNGDGIPRVLFLLREVGIVRFASYEDVYRAVALHPDRDSYELTRIIYPEYSESSIEFYLAKRDTIGRLVYLRDKGRITGGKPLKTWNKI